MNSFFQEIKTDIKYVAVIDRYNNPLFFFNTTSKDKELNYQIHIISSIEILEYKLINETDQKQASNEFLGLLLPLYEYEYDLGSYGYIGKNDIKIIIIKRFESKDHDYLDKKAQQIAKEIHTKYKNLLLNPFFSLESSLQKEKSTVMGTFVESVFSLIKNSK